MRLMRWPRSLMISGSKAIRFPSGFTTMKSPIEVVACSVRRARISSSFRERFSNSWSMSLLMLGFVNNCEATCRAVLAEKPARIAALVALKSLGYSSTNARCLAVSCGGTLR